MAGSAVATAYVKVMPSMDGVAPLIEEEFTGQGEKAGSFFSGSFGTAMKVGIAAAATAAGVVIKESLEQGAALEQSIGGIETMFGAGGKSLVEYAEAVGKTSLDVKEEYAALMTAQEQVFANAEAAYQTAGMSRNAYMENVTSFSAALIASLEGDTQKAAEVANMALVDVSDNANKFGTDSQALIQAWQGFAKGQYTLLDNLKLGYGGTKGEMERLLADAQKLTGVEYNIDNLADVYTAIHVIQEELGITGTTANEAATTVAGSFGSMKAAAQNVLGDMALGKPMEKSLEALKETTGTFLKDNLIPMVGNVLEGLPGCLETGVEAMVTWISTPENVAGMIAKALEFGGKIIGAVIRGFLDGAKNMPKLDLNFDVNAATGQYQPNFTIPGYKTGLNYVPHDDFLARLHEGEMVLPKPQAEALRKGVGGNVVVYQEIHSQAQTAADLMQAARYEQEKAVLGIG